MPLLRGFVLGVIWSVCIAPLYGAYLQIRAGKNPISVRLEAGWIDLTFGFNTHPTDSDEIQANGKSVTLIINDQQGNTLFRSGPPSAIGWYHDHFYNPEEQVINVWAKGAFAIIPSHGGGIYRGLDPDGTLIGSDAIVAGPSGPPPPNGAQPPSPPPPPSGGLPPTVPTINRHEIHAVIISGHTDPTKIVRGNVHLVGGLVALGVQPESPGVWDPGLKITADPDLITGQKVPPVTPNAFDIRIMHYQISERLGEPVDGP
ncbi:MAG: hypothetical protein JO069_15715 [Verrucomicrobia bacterium]|nr:hypothetical protein [Verrucomicrobiota bacterium]